MFAFSTQSDTASGLRLRTAIGLWLVAAASCLLLLNAYATTPSPETHSPQQWPKDVRFDHAADRPVLLVFIHPRCACTKSTFRELERLFGEVAEPVETILVFCLPLDEKPGWGETSLWRQAGRFSSARRIVDPAGHPANRFGANTSGHGLLYSREGQLVFEGGITASRGHEGEAYGRVAIRQLLAGREPVTHKTPVFGCKLILEAPEVGSFLWRQTT